MNVPPTTIKYQIIDGQDVVVTAWIGDAQRGKPIFNLNGTLITAKRPNSTSGIVQFLNGKDANGNSIRGQKLTINAMVTISNPSLSQKTSIWYDATGGTGNIPFHTAADSPIDRVVFYADVIEFV